MDAYFEEAWKTEIGKRVKEAGFRRSPDYFVDIVRKRNLAKLPHACQR